MPHRITTPESEQSILEMVADLTREEMRRMYKDGKLTSYGKRMGKLIDRVLPPKKVAEWGFLLTRKEKAMIKKRSAEKKAEAPTCNQGNLNK